MNTHKQNTIDSPSHTLEVAFKAAFDELGLAPDTPVVLTEATKPEFGDFQVNGVMGAAKKLKQNPRQLAEQVIDIIKPRLQDMVSTLEIAGPGFINIKLDDEYLANHLLQLNSGSILLNKNNNTETIVVDMSGPNLAKEMHVGHLRSTIIGDAIARIYEYLGYKVIRQNHVGDWGTQFGMLVTYLSEQPGFKNFGQDGFASELPFISSLEECYRAAKICFDTDSGFADSARRNVFILQNWQSEGELGKQMSGYWSMFCEISLRHCQEIYNKLGVKLIENDVKGESFYNDKLQQIVNTLNAKHLITQSEGAKCIFFKDDELGEGTCETTPLIIQKQDGGFLYSTTDLAAVDYRVRTLNADKIIYVVDARQSLHFKQIFCVAKKAGFATKLDTTDAILEHCGFGTMMDEGGKPFKTRTGGTVKLIDLINEAVIRAKLIINERHPAWSQSDMSYLANKLAIAAIKYADLSKNRNSDYIFNLDKMLAFDGNTAPYLLYAYTRICSIIKKFEQTHNNHNIGNTQQLVITEQIEHKLAVHLAKFTDTVHIAASECYPHYICQYLYNLAGLFMQFYEECPVIKVESEIIQQSRLEIIKMTQKILKTGLVELLGIEIVDKM
jgi:arginyl-tRNA synthetase